MKIRNGFVSNSSSSSFVAIVKDCNISEIIDVKNKEYVSLGKWLYEGVDLIHIRDPYMLKFIKLLNGGLIKDSEFNDFRIYEVIKKGEYISFTNDDMDSGVDYHVLSKRVDQSSCYNINDMFVEYYPEYCELNEEEKKKLIDKMYRTFKLERILK